MQERTNLTKEGTEKAAESPTESPALRTATIALLACGIASVVFLAGSAERRRDLSRAPSPATATTSERPTDPIVATSPAIVATPPEASPLPSPRRPAPPSSLADALATGTDFEKIAAIDAAVNAGDRSALGTLEAVDLKDQPGAAPKIIHGLSALAAKSSSSDRKRAADTLSTWLKSETSREGRDAQGNVVNLVEALGEVGDPGSVDALADALDERRLGLPVETLAVQQLETLGDRRAESSVARFMDRLQGMAPSEDAFDEQLRREAIAAAQAFLRILPR